MREMADHPTTTKHAVLLRISNSLAAEVRRLAQRDEESQSAVFRRLLRRGLDAERRSVEAGQ